MASGRPNVSDSEREILLVLWERGPLTVREVQEGLAERGFEWQRSTVITLVQRLEKKGYVHSDRSSHAFVFSASVTRADLVNQRLREVADEYCEGASGPLLLAFAQQQNLSQEDIAELRKLIDDLDSRQNSKKRKKSS